MSYTSVNNITGDLMRTKGATDAYRKGHENIFGERKLVDKPMFRLKEWIKINGEPTKEELDQYLFLGYITERK